MHLHINKEVHEKNKQSQFWFSVALKILLWFPSYGCISVRYFACSFTLWKHLEKKQWFSRNAIGSKLYSERFIKDRVFWKHIYIKEIHKENFPPLQVTFHYWRESFSQASRMSLWKSPSKESTTSLLCLFSYQEWKSVVVPSSTSY